MNAFYVINGKKLKQYFIVFLAVLFAAGVVYSEREHISVFHLEEGPAAVYKVSTNKKVLALTFDISWGETNAEPVIEALQKQGVKKATFFLNASWSKGHPDIVKKIMDAGYEIGSHGYKHTNYSELSDEEIRKQIRTAHAILSEVTGKSPNLIRLPNGDFDKRVLRIADELGYRTIQWGTDSHDWERNIGVDTIVKNVLTGAHPGDIVLLHASDSSKETHKALPAIIEGLRSKGYELVTVSELIEGADAKGAKAQEKKSAPSAPPK